jgi:hypothetical protein
LKIDILHWILFCNTAVVVFLFFSLNAFVISYTLSPKCGAMGMIFFGISDRLLRNKTVMDLGGGGTGQSVKGAAILCQAHCFHGWLALPGSHTQLGNRSNIFVDWKTAKASFHTFEEVHIKWNNIEALLGRAHFYKLNQGYVEALGELSQVLPDPYLQQNMEGGTFSSICWCLLRRVQSIF